jgi:hypothetical protein
VSFESTLSSNIDGLSTPVDDLGRPESLGPTPSSTTVDDKIMTLPTHNTRPTDRVDHRPHGPPPLTRTKFRRKSARKIGPSPHEKKSAGPTHPTVLNLTVTVLSSTNTTLAGVAQSVERVALTTAKRSTSRSWVRAPPSAIPIIQAHQSSCSFALLVFASVASLVDVGRFFSFGGAVCWCWSLVGCQIPPSYSRKTIKHRVAQLASNPWHPSIHRSHQSSSSIIV